MGQKGSQNQNSRCWSWHIWKHHQHMTVDLLTVRRPWRKRGTDIRLECKWKQLPDLHLGKSRRSPSQPRRLQSVADLRARLMYPLTKSEHLLVRATSVPSAVTSSPHWTERERDKPSLSLCSLLCQGWYLSGWVGAEHTALASCQSKRFNVCAVTSCMCVRI